MLKNFLTKNLIENRRSILQFPLNSRDMPHNLNDSFNRLLLQCQFLWSYKADNFRNFLQCLRVFPLCKFKRIHGFRIEFITLPSLLLFVIWGGISCTRICLCEWEWSSQCLLLITCLFLVHRCRACSMLWNGCIYKLQNIQIL
jgi:hypothetical protein